MMWRVGTWAAGNNRPKSGLAAAALLGSMLASAGAQFYLTPRLSFLAKFDGEFASGSQTYSGTGTLRYNPDIRWRLQPADIAELAGKQRQILETASAMVRPGGLLLYSTCSLEKDENEAVTTEFLEHHPDFLVSRFGTHHDLQTKGDALRTWPHLNDVDGFFVMAFQRKR